MARRVHVSPAPRRYDLVHTRICDELAETLEVGDLRPSRFQMRSAGRNLTGGCTGLQRTSPADGDLIDVLRRPSSTVDSPVRPTYPRRHGVATSRRKGHLRSSSPLAGPRPPRASSLPAAVTPSSMSTPNSAITSCAVRLCAIASRRPRSRRELASASRMRRRCCGWRVAARHNAAHHRERGLRPAPGELARHTHSEFAEAHRDSIDAAWSRRLGWLDGPTSAVERF